MVGSSSIAYLVSVHPFLSQAFVLREVQGLRDLGWHVEVLSIAAPDRPLAQMAVQERQEVEQTWYLKSQPLSAWMSAHLAAFFTQPRAYLRAAGRALALAGPNPRDLAYHAAYFAQAILAAQRLKRRGFRHVHTHFASPLTVLLTSLGVQLSITVHGPDEFYDIGRFRLRQKVEAASFLVAISQFARSQLMLLAPPQQWNKIEVVRLGVDVDLFHPAPQEPSAVCEILCIGRLVPQKGQRLAVEAMRRLKRKGLAVRLRVVGAGPDHDALARLIRELDVQDVVCLEGPVNQDRIAAFYRQASFFVLPSFAEGIPVVLMEAMAMGIPCVSTRITGIAELIHHQENGLLVAAGDLDALTEAIERMASDAAMRQRFGLAARATVVSDFNLKTNLVQLSGLFQRRLRVSGEESS